MIDTIDPVTNVRPLGDHDLLEAVELLVAEQSTILNGMKEFLRDYFASAAMSVLLTKDAGAGIPFIATTSYKIADAMLAARQK